MTAVTIRQAGPTDTPFLERMQWLAIMASPGLVQAVGQEELKEMEARTWATWPQPDEVAFIADSADGIPLGAVLLRVEERRDNRILGYRLAIAVDGFARGRGVGRQLMQHAHRFAVSRGAEYLLLRVDPSNSAAIQLYRSEGFEDGDRHSVIPMTLRFGARGLVASD